MDAEIPEPASILEVEGTPSGTPEAEPAPAHSRDPQYYFEDGSVVLLVKSVLFRIHTSQITAESQVFKDMFSMPSCDKNGADGTSDQRPVVIPDVEPAQFRNLMKMFYCRPSSHFFALLQGGSPEEACLTPWDSFKFHLDVASLSHRFAMVEMEEWARSQLNLLLSTLGKKIVKKSQWDHSAVLMFLRATEFARIIHDHNLANELKGILQYHLVGPKWTSLSETLRIFRIPNLRAEHPSLFGYLFTLLLVEDPNTWRKKDFTKVDRMALYSGVVSLTPIPKSLKVSIRSPLFREPTDLHDFRSRFIPDPSNPFVPELCSQGCDRVVMKLWLDRFGDDYYESIVCDRIGGPIPWLANLPRSRHVWAKEVRDKLMPKECSQCYTRYIDQLDQDLELLFTRVGEYYRPIE